MTPQNIENKLQTVIDINKLLETNAYLVFFSLTWIDFIIPQLIHR